MAIHAGEEITVDRMLQLGLIDVKADLLAVDLGCQGCVGMTGKAVCILGLVLGAGCVGDGKKKEENKNETETVL